jgi:hypothetical protein
MTDRTLAVTIRRGLLMILVAITARPVPPADARLKQTAIDAIRSIVCAIEDRYNIKPAKLS